VGALGERTLYVTAEESAAQVRLRADRTGRAARRRCTWPPRSDLGTVLGHIEEVPHAAGARLGADHRARAPRGRRRPNQVREVTNALVARGEAARAWPCMIVGHVTKDGAIAGPRTWSTWSTWCSAFEGDRHGGFRMVRATKNRFGPADEVGCFEMTRAGIVEVPDPSGLFTSGRFPTPGTCVTVSLEGRRPLLAEVQALVVPRAPRRRRGGSRTGSTWSRSTMTLAVLQRRAGHKLSHPRRLRLDGGRGRALSDPSADLALAIAVASAMRDDEPAAASSRSARSGCRARCGACPRWAGGSPRPPGSGSSGRSSRPARARTPPPVAGIAVVEVRRWRTPCDAAFGPERSNVVPIESSRARLDS
jgi:DNA repair protein RadA/Sms